MSTTLIFNLFSSQCLFKFFSKSIIFEILIKGSFNPILSASSQCENKFNISHTQADNLNECAIEFSKKMNHLEKLLNSAQLVPNNLQLGRINNYAKIKENGHLHQIYNAGNCTNLESTLNAFIASKKLKNSDFGKLSAHYAFAKDMRKLVDSMAAKERGGLPDLRGQLRPHLAKEDANNRLKENQIHQQSIRFNTKQIKQFNSSLHLTPNLIAGILNSDNMSTSNITNNAAATATNTLFANVINKANDNFFMPNIEKETAKNINNISSSQTSKSRKRVIAFYHRVNENEYNPKPTGLASKIRPK